ncbi:chemotaxis protein CheW [Vibrio metschnikovii]|uniref:chemotaxis protein CheW n=1 Tax=Vibrio metschnikovii TaxID=28172 RepID=UPI002FC6D06D
MGQLATPNLATSINDQQYLTFLLNGEMYAFAILNVKEILEYGKVTPIPRMPKFILPIIVAAVAEKTAILIECQAACIKLSLLIKA